MWVEQQLLQSQFSGSNSNSNSMPQHATCTTCCMEMRCVEKQPDGNLNFSSYSSSCSFPSSHLLLLLLFLSSLQTHTQGQGNSNCRYTRTEAHCREYENSIECKIPCGFREGQRQIYTGQYAPPPFAPFLSLTHTPLHSCVDRWQTTRKRCASSKTRSTYRMWHITVIWRKRPPWRSNVDPLKSPTAAVSSVPHPFSLSLFVCSLSCPTLYLFHSLI